MRTKAIIPFFGCALLLAVSCDVKDPIYNTPHPDHGTVTLTADWSRRGTDIDIPASYTDRKSTRLNSSHSGESRMPSSA